MNYKQLTALLNKLYPADMLKARKAERVHFMNSSWMEPTKAYRDRTIALAIFISAVGDMDNPRLTLTDADHALQNWKTTQKFLDHDRAEVKNPNTCLDKSFYTPDYFQKTQAYIDQNVQKTREVASTLDHADDLYIIAPHALNNKADYKPLTKDLVKLTVMASVRKYRQEHEDPQASLVSLPDVVKGMAKTSPSVKELADKVYQY